jgi:Zn-dependent protease
MGQDFIIRAALYAIPLLISVILHEVSHGWVADKLGDPTARMMGRITLNPLVHIDPVGTVLLPIVLLVSGSPFIFGWAKPVPVQFENLKGGRRDMALVAAAGPVTNFLLACAAAFVFRLILAGAQDPSIVNQTWFQWIADPLLQIALIFVTFNLVLMLFNLMPIPPLDGGRIAVGLLPLRLAYQVDRFERFGMLIVLVVIMTGTWRTIFGPAHSFFRQLLLG